MIERFAALVLWTLVEPWSLLFGLVAAIGAYTLLRPRERPGWHELRGEAWRILAIAAAGPTFLFGAELSLWAWMMGFRAPIAYTGLPAWLGMVLLVAALVPPAAAWAYGRSVARGALVGLAICAMGAGLIAAGRSARAAAWNAQAASVAPGDTAGFAEVARLKVYRYIGLGEVQAVLDRALPAARDVLQVAEMARATEGRGRGGAEAAGPPPGPPPGGSEGLDTRRSADLAQDDSGSNGSAGSDMVLDGDLRELLAMRIESALVAGEPSIDGEAVPALWWLTGDEHRTLRAYALTRPALRSSAIDGGPLARDVLRDALLMAPDDVERAILSASYGPLMREQLGAPLVEVLAAHQAAPEPVGRLATLILLREASRESLRPVAPRFADPDAPEWAYLREECPARMIGLDQLSEDPDPEVAAGARALRRYVEMNCVSWVQQG